MDVIAWIGFSQALFSGILTITKKKQSISDKLLSAWLFLLAIEFLSFGIESKIYPDFLFLTNTFLLFNPALYIYTCSLTNPDYKLRINQLLHILPYLFFKITAWIIKEPQSFETFFDPDKTLWFRILFTIFGISSWVVYLTLSVLLLKKHRKTVKNEFSTIDIYINYAWLMFVIILYVTYCFTVFIWGITNLIYYNTLSLSIFNYSMLLVFIYIFGFYGLKQEDLFKRKNNPSILPKPQTLNISISSREKIKNSLLHYFEKDSPYLNPDLNMTLLSEKIKIPKHHITEVLNNDMDKNFFQFVNEYRIEAVKIKLIDPKNPYSIEAIGYECGFNSKSTFFSVFKNITGMTPSEYKNKANSNF
ncbi:MAG: AraC family transcriptional regulator [Prolixibacteraceae bacterium]|nr:AraC family transcriptional regulator [Prolixibacteraceae bacterium]